MIDRTAEFGGAAEVLRRLAEGDPHAARMAPTVRLPARPPIHRESLDLSVAVRAAAHRTGRLYRLAHRRGLFDDPAAEINGLTVAAKRDIADLEELLRALLAGVARQDAGGRAAPANSGGGGGDDASLPGFGGAGGAGSATSARAHWAAVADCLRGHVLDLTRQFSDALRLRSENLKEQAARRKQFARSTWAPLVSLDSPLFGGGSAGGGDGRHASSGEGGSGGGGGTTVEPPGSGAGEEGGGWLRRRAPASQTASANGGVNAGSATTSVASGLRQQQQQQQHLNTGSGGSVGGGAMFYSPGRLKPEQAQPDGRPPPPAHLQPLQPLSLPALLSSYGRGSPPPAATDAAQFSTSDRGGGANEGGGREGGGTTSGLVSRRLGRGPPPTSAPFTSSGNGGTGGYYDDSGDSGTSAYSLKWGRSGGGSSGYTAQQLAQYHTATNRAAEMRAAEASIVEIGHMMTVRRRV